MASDIQKNLAANSVWKLLVQYSGPAIIASVCVSLYNIVDSIFIGKGVGPMALTALAICLPLMNLIVAFCNLVAAGGSAVSSIFLGKKRVDLATDTLNNVVVLSLAQAVVFGGLMLVFLDELLYLFGATEETFNYAYRFMRIFLWCTPISFLFLGLNNLLRATGYPKKAMISALFSVVVNVCVAPVLIFKCRIGMEGAAWATVAGQTAGLIWVSIHFLHRKSLVHIDLSRRWFTPEIFKRIYAIGLSPFLMNICACFIVVFLNHSLLKYGHADGNYDVGAYGILNRVTMVFVMIVFGVTQGMQPILGFNYGAGQWDRVKQCLKLGIWLGVAVTTIGWGLTELCPDMLSGMFTDSELMTQIARRGFRIYFIFYPLVGFQIVVQNFFQSIGKPKISILLSLTRQLIFLLPFLYFLPQHWGVDGIWASMSGADMLAAIVAALALRFTKVFRKPEMLQSPK